MTVKSCATCRYWVPTEMEAVSASHHPHQRDTRAETEMLRATHALCSWPSHSHIGYDNTPPWVMQRVGDGTLTCETDGTDCPVHQGKAIEWKPGTRLNAGEKVTMEQRPPFDWLDNLTWRLFRWVRHRPAVRQTYVVSKSFD